MSQINRLALLYFMEKTLLKMETEECKKHKIFIPEMLSKLGIKGQVSSVTVPPNQRGKTVKEKYLIIMERKEKHGESAT